MGDHTDDEVVLEGFHAVKHALRFGADVHDLLTTDAAEVERLRDDLAPDIRLEGLVEVDAATWTARVGRELPSPLVGWCRRPLHTLDDVAGRSGRVVVLEQPRHLGNLGAVVRVAAAAGAARVLTTGDADPWHPMAVRAAAGLHLALPVLCVDLADAVDRLRDAGRSVVALHGDGDDLHAAPPTEDAVLLLGTERAGLSPTARDLADRHVAIAMRHGVSSLNLATAAAVALYTAARP